MRKSHLPLIVAIILSFSSCKEKDTTINPISLPDAETILEGRWQLVFTRAEGNARIGTGTFPVSGTNLNTPEGFYELNVGKEENTYSYDVKTLLNMVIGENAAITREYDYNDKDGGTWEIKSDEEVTFYANQGNIQDIFFTKYDSLEVEHLQFAIPVDTVLESVGYKGNVILDMVKIQ